MSLRFIILRVGLAFSFLYPAIHAWFHPDSWIGYIPAFALSLWPASDLLLLHLFGALEIVLALWLLSGWKIRIPAATTFFLLLFVVFTNLNQFEVLFRDLGLAAMSLFLFVRSGPRADEKFQS